MRNNLCWCIYDLRWQVITWNDSAGTIITRPKNIDIVFVLLDRSSWWLWCLGWSTSSASGRRDAAAATEDGRDVSALPGSLFVS